MTDIVVRGWGSYEVLLDDCGVKVKRITLSPNKRMSLQLHRERDELWLVISGAAFAQVGNETKAIETGDILVVPRLEVHRLTNESDSDMVMIEIQTGDCWENDIIRIEDDYGRGIF